MVFVFDHRPKFTAKARSSQSLRTRQEAPGADQPILNGKNAELSPGFVSDQRPKFTAKARSSQSLRTRKKAPGADQPILNGKNADSPGQSEAPPWVRKPSDCIFSIGLLIVE